MKGIGRERELIAFGAYLASEAHREAMTSTNFVDDDIANCIKEMESVLAGDTKKEDMRNLPAFLEKLKCPNVGRAIDGVIDAVKSNRRTVEAAKLGRRLQMAKPHEIDQLKERAANL